MIKFFTKFLNKMLNFFKKPTEIQGDSEIRIIGPRRSGKTTFLAALALWPQYNDSSPIEFVKPMDNYTTSFVDQAQDILMNGSIFPADMPVDNPNDLPCYNLLIKLKQDKFGEDIKFQISCKDHPGEIFNDFRGKKLFQGRINEYVGDISNVSAFMILIDGKSSSDQNEKEYIKSLENLKEELKKRFKGKKKLSSLRIAIVFSKAEDCSVKIYLNDIEKFKNKKYPTLTKMLNQWKKEWHCAINYFYCSAFGVIGDDSPNTKNTNGQNVIERLDLWQPLGLLAPIYWLYSGKDNQRLRELENTIK